MPEPLLYLKAMSAAAIFSAMFVLAVAGLRRPAGATRLNLACVLAAGLGLAIGYCALSLRLVWPPASGLDRFLTIVIPAALGIELIAGFERVSRRVAWLLRVSLAAAVPRILLHGSVYLSGSESEWTLWQAVAVLVVCAGLLAGVWALLAWLSQRSSGVSISLALAMSTLCAGMTVMMAGYIKGGVAAFPMAATVVATSLGAELIARRSGTRASAAAPATAGMAVVGLFGLLFIGRFFGRLSTGAALVMLLAPLLCWSTEIPLLRDRRPWLVGSLRLALVAIPLIVVLTLAKRDFDRKMAPLLSQEISPASSTACTCRDKGGGHGNRAFCGTTPNRGWTAFAQQQAGSRNRTQHGSGRETSNGGPAQDARRQLLGHDVRQRIFSEDLAFRRGGSMSRRIAVGGFLTECNCFGGVPIGLERFKQQEYLQGAELLQRCTRIDEVDPLVDRTVNQADCVRLFNRSAECHGPQTDGRHKQSTGAEFAMFHLTTFFILRTTLPDEALRRLGLESTLRPQSRPRKEKTVR